jgi:hypothetical protein
MDNQYGLDAEYFNRLFARELAPDVVRNQTPACLARVLLRAARTACPGVLREEEFNYEHLRGYGQVRAGDKIRFTFNGKVVTRRVAEVLHAGTEQEEIIYARKKNFYIITKMALNGGGHAKNVMIRIRPLESDK